jgi:hypothetical protein
MKISKYGKILSLVIFGLLTGCASSGGYENELKSYLAKTPEAQEVAIAKKIDEGNASYEFEKATLFKGDVVKRNIDDYEFSVHWNRLSRTLTTYSGHITSTFGHQTDIIAQVITEVDSPKPVFVTGADGLPKTEMIAGNTRDVPTFARDAVFSTMGIVESASNNYFGLRALGNASCGSGCGGNGGGDIINNIQGSSANAATTTIIGCNSGNCIDPARQQ